MDSPERKEDSCSPQHLCAGLLGHTLPKDSCHFLFSGQEAHLTWPLYLQCLAQQALNKYLWGEGKKTPTAAQPHLGKPTQQRVCFVHCGIPSTQPSGCHIAGVGLLSKGILNSSYKTYIFITCFVYAFKLYVSIKLWQTAFHKLQQIQPKHLSSLDSSVSVSSEHVFWLPF